MEAGPNLVAHPLLPTDTNTSGCSTQLDLVNVTQALYFAIARVDLLIGEKFSLPNLPHVPRANLCVKNVLSQKIEHVVWRYPVPPP